MADKKRKIEFEITAKDTEFRRKLEEGKKAAQDVEKSGQKAASSLAQVAGAVGAAFAGSKVLGFFKGAVVEANKLENAMLKVSSTAKAMNQNIERSKQAAMDLASDGFMSANQAAQSLSNLMQTGLSLDQAKGFVEASKDITAFGNIIGDAAQATEDLTAGLLKGSSLVIDNASPALKSLSREYEKILQTQGKAAAAQFAYNKILKESSKFSGDAARSLETLTGAQKKFEAATSSLSAEIGKALQPVLKVLLDIATNVINKFTEWYNGLGKTAQTIVALTPIIATVAAAIAALLPLIATLAGAFGWIPLVIVALGALAAAIANVGKFRSAEDAAASYQKAKKEILGMGKELDRLNAIQKKTAEQELQSIKLKTELSERAKQLGTTYEALAADAKSYYDIAVKLQQLERAKAKREVGALGEGLIGGLGELQRQRADAIAALTRARQKGDREAQIDTKTQIAELDVAIKNQKAQIEATRKRFLDMDKEVKGDVAASNLGGGSGEMKGTEARFVETQRRLQEIERNRIYTMAKLEGDLAREGFVKGTAQYSQELQRRRDMARSDANLQVAQEKEKLRQVFAEYIEDETMMRQAALQQQTQNALRASQERLELELRQAGQNEALIQDAKEANEKRLQTIRKANARKEGHIMAEAIQRTLQGANIAASGFSQMLQARDIGSALSGQGGFLTGLSQLSPALSALGPMGGAVGAAGGIISTFTSLFGKSDEQRAREAEAQKRRDDEAKAILELQANYQKSMLALQEAEAKLPFENLARNQRLVDIQAQQRRLAGENETDVEAWRLQQRQVLLNEVMAKESSTIAGGRLFGDIQATPESLISFINERAGQSAAIAMAMGLGNSLQNVVGMNWTGAMNYITEIMRQLDSIRGQIPPELYNALRGPMQRTMDSFNWYISQTYDPNKNTVTSVDLSYFMGEANTLQSEITRDVGTAENLLSVIEQSQQTQLEIAANTKKTADALTLQGAREQRFIDIAGGGLRGFGQFMAGNIGVNTGAMTLPSGVSNTILATQQAKSIDEQMNAKLGDLVMIARDQARFLGEIAVNTGRMAGANVTGSPSEFEVLERLKAYEARS